MLSSIRTLLHVLLGDIIYFSVVVSTAGLIFFPAVVSPVRRMFFSFSDFPTAINIFPLVVSPVGLIFFPSVIFQ